MCTAAMVMQGQLVLVGDPQQLPPTVLSRAACAGLSQSLFERLQRGGAAAALLRFQYRMHPAISAFPSAFFYDRDLLDGTSAPGMRATFHSKVLTLHSRFLCWVCQSVPMFVKHMLHEWHAVSHEGYRRPRSQLQHPLLDTSESLVPVGARRLVRGLSPGECAACLCTTTVLCLNQLVSAVLYDHVACINAMAGIVARVGGKCVGVPWPACVLRCRAWQAGARWSWPVADESRGGEAHLHRAQLRLPPPRARGYWHHRRHRCLQGAG